MKHSYILVILLLISIGLKGQNKTFTLKGVVKDSESGESLPATSVRIPELDRSAYTDANGSFEFQLPAGTYTVVIDFMGYEKLSQTVKVTKNTDLKFKLKSSNIVLNSVKITQEGLDESVNSTEIGTEEVSIETISKLPAIMGEVDPIKTLQLLPGVVSAGEGTGGFFVRGGDNSQNLVLLDQMPIYNASHLFGFFSVFNPNAISGLKLYKSNIPAHYGGRLSSLLDVSMKDADTKKFNGTAGIGLISSRLTLETPLVKGKSSLIVSGRRSYIDLFFPMLPDESLQDDKISFYDLNAKYTHRINDNNTISLSGYKGQDNFRFGDEFAMGWGNQAAALSWKHTFSDNWFLNSSLVVSDFDYYLGVPDGEQGFDWNAGVNEYTANAGLTNYLNANNTLKIGFTSSYRVFDLGTMDPVGDQSIFNSLRIGEDRSLDHSIYVENEQKIGKRIVANYGLRYNIFSQVGNDTINIYGGNDGEDIIGYTAYGDFEHIKTYHGFEPRFAIRYKVDTNSSIKASYTRTRQNIHLLSNTSAGSPFDIWLSSSEYIAPQLSDQVSLGYFRNFRDNMFAASVEVYYKNMQNQIDFKPNKQLLINPIVETTVLPGIGWSYGSEFMLKKQTGRLQGWLSYTLSRTQRRVIGLNNDKPYSPAFDKTHDFAAVATYDINQYWTVGANWVYTTGAAATFPAGNYVTNGYTVPYYNERNSFRYPANHRLDVSATKQVRKGLLFKKHEREWIFSVYNLYWRKNVYSINFRPSEEDPDKSEAVLTYLFGTIPSVTYNIKF